MSPSRSFRPRFGLRERLELDERDRSRRFFFERLSSLFDRLRLRLFVRVTVMNFLFTYVSISPSSYLCGNRISRWRNPLVDFSRCTRLDREGPVGMRLLDDAVVLLGPSFIFGPHLVPDADLHVIAVRTVVAGAHV